MDARARHVHQIKRADDMFGSAFESALHRVINRSCGFDWFTDEQVAEIRAEMIGRDWFRHKLHRENRKRRAA